jgi:uncharacterized protein (DUF2235 family)
MKRLVILIDGTWNEEGQGEDTNVAKLHAARLIKPVASDGVRQIVDYHPGVGVEVKEKTSLRRMQQWATHILGGSVGFGLKTIIQTEYEFLLTILNRAMSSISLAFHAAPMRLVPWLG